MFNMFSGGAVQRMAIFALNVMPYISASIIVQLLGTIYPPWEKLRKEGGEAGRKQLNQYTRYLTVVLALFQSVRHRHRPADQPGRWCYNPGPFFMLSTVVTLTGGTMFLMWLGEQITSRGVGNGVSLIIFAGIVARLPTARLPAVLPQAQHGPAQRLHAAGHRWPGASAVIVFIVFMERSQRRLLVQYPKRQVGNRMFGGDTQLPAAEDQHLRRDPADLRLVACCCCRRRRCSFLTTAQPAQPWLQWLPALVGQLQHGQPAVHGRSTAR